MRDRFRMVDLWAPGLVFLGVFGVATWSLTPDAPGREPLARAAREEAYRRTTDFHYSGCRAARANGHENIAASEPSYRPEMDGDGDGLACEPYRG